MKYAALVSTLALASAYDGEIKLDCQEWYQFHDAPSEFTYGNDRHALISKTAAYSNYTKLAVSAKNPKFCIKMDAHNVNADF